MLFKDSERVIYKKNPLLAVIFQVKFPTILAINAKDPVDFQETIRTEFPVYNLQIENEQQIMLNSDPGLQVFPQIVNTSSIKNHTFISGDGHTKINLTNTFISLSTDSYHCWEDFFSSFSMAFNSFVEIYKPAYFERVGLRYIDAFKRSSLGISDVPWSDLIQPHVLGILSKTEESNVLTNTTDAELRLDNPYNILKVHAGIGQVGNDTEPQFIIDGDFFCTEKTETKFVFDVANKLHSYSSKFIRGSITEKLHLAMEPQKL